MPQWMSMLFLCVVPSIAAVGFWVLSEEYKLVGNIMISVGACGISLFVTLFTIGTVVMTLGGTEADGTYYRGPLITGWVISAILAFVFAILVHHIDLWSWLMTGFFGAGCFISGLGISFLICHIFELVFGGN